MSHISKLAYLARHNASRTIPRNEKYFKLLSSSSHLTGSAFYSPHYLQERNLSGRKGFLENLVDTIKQEFKKDPELQKNIKKFREEAKELEDSDALKKAREKFQKIEKETSQSTEAIQEAFGKIKSKVSETAEDLSKSEMGKSAQKIRKGVSGAAKAASESETVKKVQSGFQNLAEGTGVAPAGLYRAPTVLRMRKIEVEGDQKEFEADTETTNVVMHKDSVWSKQWDTFKNSPVGERLSEIKLKYDESDNLFIRSTRFITDKVTSVAGGMFGGTDISKVMTEVAKIEPTFSATNFVRFCRYDVIPNLLEAISQGKEDIVKDWCTEAPFNQLMFAAHQAKKIHCKYHVKTIDVDNVEIVGGTKVDQGPVLVISFQSQQIMYVENSRGDVVEGDPDRVMLVHHVWALCRDLEEFDPSAGWKMIDQQMQATPMLL